MMHITINGVNVLMSALEEATFIASRTPTQEQIQAKLAYIDSKRIASLWQAAHDYENAQISGSAIGLLTMGVLQAKPKCLAVQMWIKSIWVEYYTRKATGSTNYDFSMSGDCPHSIPELMEELGV